ncbi:hypothetical protein FHX59_000441 [Paraburkholderia silvatlantica]|uniref:Uncharacterized protein n=1 Tax=Paraburkholderia silvatlantica TaxID=321895 RepID=A0ABR6FF43_9BURK|nr:hypothetical protein [Paraburkholderia silvatlantica]PVY33567.1 hypothetical protein C7411_108221 [Paraburkholderia silvatlantica]PXW38507.1 hypothetical protein C7413_108221 [Paraburkholderia silvatlantica]TDQ92959.1 hypothetical protein C7412_110221 [Paraburkholderia silvatlantica]
MKAPLPDGGKKGTQPTTIWLSAHNTTPPI